MASKFLGFDIIFALYLPSFAALQIANKVSGAQEEPASFASSLIATLIIYGVSRLVLEFFWAFFERYLQD